MPHTRSAPIERLLLRLVGAACALAVCAGVAAAQASAGAGGAGSHEPVPKTPGVFGGPGGQYLPPGDAGGGGGGDDDDDGGGGSGGSGPGGNKGAGGQPDSGHRPIGAPGAGAPPTISGGRGGTAQPGDLPSTGNTPSDTWDQWWETNKFDFIELRRVQDAPVTPQGSLPETAAERELRLAGIRAHLRDQVLPVLRELTASSDDAVRGSAVVALGKLRDSESLDRIGALLGDGNLEVRRSAMLALGVLSSGRGAWMLLHVGDDSQHGRTLVNASPVPVDDRGTALLAASLRGDDSGEQLLLQLLTDRKGTPTELLALVADAAGLLGSTEVIRPLIDLAFDQDLPEHVRSAATSALGRIGDPSVTPALVELLDLGLEPRRAATLALGQVAHPGATKVIEKLANLLEHESDAPTRHFAAVSLGRIGGSAARAALVSALARDKDDSRPWIALGLGLCERKDGSGTVAPLLLEKLGKEGNADSQGALIIALGLTRSEQATPRLVDTLQRGSSELSGRAAMALGLSGQAAATHPLREALARSTDPRVLRQAAMGLGVLGDTASIPALLELIRTTNNPFVASYASIGIAFMGEADAAGPLLDMIQRHGPSGVTTTWAVAAVGQLFDLDRRPALSRLAAGDNYLVRPTAVANLLDLGY